MTSRVIGVSTATILSYRSLVNRALRDTFSGESTIGNARPQHDLRGFRIDVEVELGVRRVVAAAVGQRGDGAAHDHQLLDVAGEVVAPSASPSRCWSAGRWPGWSPALGSASPCWTRKSTALLALEPSSGREAAGRRRRRLVGVPAAMPLRVPLGALVQQRAGRALDTPGSRCGWSPRGPSAHRRWRRSRLRLPATVVMPRISSSGELSTKNNAIASSCGGKAKSVSKMIFCAGCAAAGTAKEHAGRHRRRFMGVGPRTGGPAIARPSRMCRVGTGSSEHVLQGQLDLPRAFHRRGDHAERRRADRGVPAPRTARC